MGRKPKCRKFRTSRSGPTIFLHFHHCTWTCRCRAAQDVRERPSLEVKNHAIKSINELSVRTHPIL